MRPLIPAALLLAYACGSSNPEPVSAPTPADSAALARATPHAFIAAREQYYDIDGSSARADDGAHGAARHLVRRPLGPGHAHGGADRGGRPGEEPRLRCPNAARPDAGGGARALGRDREPQRQDEIVLQAGAIGAGHDSPGIPWPAGHRRTRERGTD